MKTHAGPWFVFLHTVTRNGLVKLHFFPDDDGPEPSKPLRADLGVYEGARMHLLHDYNRPYYVGFDALSDAGSENVETFLHLASHIVQAAENLLIKQKASAIHARAQHNLLVERAGMVIDSWNFPEHRRVRALATWIAERCKARSLGETRRSAPVPIPMAFYRTTLLALATNIPSLRTYLSSRSHTMRSLSCLITLAKTSSGVSSSSAESSSCALAFPSNGEGLLKGPRTNSIVN